ncbi:hypothetical protein [Actinokineospora globicatena]|uniref:FtsK gamma domain-containing protein n=1 Tax=Actinokineospora globicatena TaxID=103729 RepID=A0A9W6V9Q9_9PSEU|nr:hypothetical protein [Actinokineospora globicatena]GLW95435.1 hypothetical protein Aglo03_62510 [Actinokineospora globicatena]
MRWRKAALFAVMSGALALTVHGEVAAVSPMLGTGFGAVMAGVFALSTLLALNFVIDGQGSVRVWAWAVLVLAGGMELGLNTWHALTKEIVNAEGMAGPALPVPAAVAVGAGPVVLAGLLSHLVALTMTPSRPEGEHTEAPVVASMPTPVTSIPVGPAEVPSHRGEVRLEPQGDGVQVERPRTGTPPAPRKAIPAGTGSGPKQPRTDEQLLAILSYPELVPRDEDGTVPVRRAARELGCGVDRARKLLRQEGLLTSGPDTDGPAVRLIQAV